MAQWQADGASARIATIRSDREGRVTATLLRWDAGCAREKNVAPVLARFRALYNRVGKFEARRMRECDLLMSRTLFLKC